MAKAVHKAVNKWDRGEITERGTHHSLLQIEGWYKEQYTIQKLEDGNEP